MVIRPSQKLAKKIGLVPKLALPLDANPFADWSGHLFTADRTQYVILTNTASLYSAILYGRGITDDRTLLNRGMDAIREVIEGDDLNSIYGRMVATSTVTIAFSKSLNRSVTGSMNDLICCAKDWLVDEQLSPRDVSIRVNETPMSSIGYAYPREAFKAMIVGQDEAR
jgi:hypothetical protein